MLSKEAVNTLKWIAKYGDWKYYYQIEEDYPKLEHWTFKALISDNYLDHCTLEDTPPMPDEDGSMYYPEVYRISDMGKAYLEELHTRNVDRWVNYCFSTLALTISVIALLSQLGIIRLK